MRFAISRFEVGNLKNKNKGKKGPAGRPFPSARENDSVAREGQRTRLGEKTAERKESFFRKTEVTAEAVSYKAKAEAKSAGKSACATEVGLVRGERNCGCAKMTNHEQDALHAAAWCLSKIRSSSRHSADLFFHARANYAGAGSGRVIATIRPACNFAGVAYGLE